jgi:4-amino-4-deoxy-L-arabinose transferase-like glycosyltransferase
VNRVSKIILLLAVIFAVFTRFWNLSILPYPPDGDEVAFGYYGWSLLHFGTDEYGKFLPTSFTSIGDNKYPGLPYLNIIPAAIFGLNNIEIRFWNAAGGVIMVVLIYFLTEYFFTNRRISLFAAWSAALSPWGIIVSRLGYEVFIPTVLVTAGITCLLYSFQFKKEKPKKILFASSVVLFLISIFTHASARFFVPSFLFVLFASSFYKKSLFSKHKKTLGILFIFLSLIVVCMLFSPNSWGRAKDDIWKGPSAEENNRLQELYIQAGTSQIKLPARITWAFHNKYRIAIFDFVDRYMEHFSVGYLFTKGESSGQAIPDMGVLLFMDLLLLPAGIFALAKNNNKDSVRLIASWLLIAPIPSALTIGVAKMDRVTLLIVPLCIISALGFGYITDLFKKKSKLAIFFISIGVAISSLYSLNQIFVQKPLDKPWTNQEVFEDMTKSILDLKDKYKSVAMTGDDYIYFLFYGKISPKEFIKRSDINSEQWNRVTRLDNIYFNMPYKCPKGGKLNVLYVCGGGDVPQNSKIIKYFYYPDGVPAYSLIEFYPVSKMPPKDKLPTLPGRLHYMVDYEHKYVDGIIPEESKSLW